MKPGDLLEQRYRLVRVLGRGRSGSVWCARNELIDRSVAVKVLHRQLAGDPERLQRFFQEARACGRVRHPAVVEVLDLGQSDDGILFLVMELLDGEPMSSLLQRKGQLQTDEALALMVPIARGLAAAHSHGILHRDLKPANIYLHKSPIGALQPKILDFGISKILGSDLTSSGVVLGTPSYMSPEQARGLELDPRTDVFALGVILYEALAGKLPFQAKDYRSLVTEICERQPTPIQQLAKDVPGDLAHLLDETLEKQREKRVGSALALAQKLTFVLRRRGRDDLLRSPDDEFSEGAPTLLTDRGEFEEAASKLRPRATSAPPPPAVPVVQSLIDPDAEITQKRHTLRAPGGAPPEPTVIARAPSPLTAAIASQTSGAKKRDESPVVRPAAGKPASIVAEPARRPTLDSETTAPGAPIDMEAEPKLTTSAWEVAAVRASLGHAEVLLGSGLPPRTQRVESEWETTVADVSHEQMMPVGAAPEVVARVVPSSQRTTTGAWESPPARVETVSRPAPAIAPASVPPREVEPVKSAPAPLSPGISGRTLRPEGLAPAAKLEVGFGAIPGFTAPTPAPSAARGSNPPPAPARAKPVLPAPRKSAPPPPPRTATPPPPAMTKTAAQPAPPAPITPPKVAAPPLAPAPTQSTARKAPPPPPVSSAPPLPPPRRTTPPPPPKRGNTPPPPTAGTAAPDLGELAAAASIGSGIPGANAPHRPTLRPPTAGFAVPANAPGAPPPPPSAAPPPMTAPERAPTAATLVAMAAPAPIETTPIHPPPASGPAEAFALQAPSASPFDLLRAPAGAPTASDVAPTFEDTRRSRTRATPLRGQALIAAVVGVFVVGALLGTVAASTRASHHQVGRLAVAESLIVGWHRAESDLQDAEKSTRAGKQKALRDAEERAAAELAAKAEPTASAAPSASEATTPIASVEPPASAAPSASEKSPASKPPTKLTSGPTKTKPAGSTPPTKSPPTKASASTTPKKGYSSTGDDAPKKKGGEKEWWEKKY